MRGGVGREDRDGLGIVAAIARGGVIGQSGAKLGLPWHIPEDLKHFKALTMGHAIIMGRTTHEAIGRALPKRLNIVLTRAEGTTFDGCTVAGSLSEAIRCARAAHPDRMPLIIGGANVYAQAIPLASVLHLTRVDRDVEGDAFFPDFDADQFDVIDERAGETPGVVFTSLRRR